MRTPYRILRLRSGEDIITRIKGKRDNKYIIERPMQMKISSIIDPENNKVVRKDFLLFRDWLQYTNHNETEVPEDWVAIILTPDEHASVSYDRAKEDEDVNPRTESITIPNKETTEEPMETPLRNNIDPNCIMVTLAIPPMIFISLLSQGLLNAGHFGGEEEFENENEDEDGGPGNKPTDWSPNIEDYFDDED